VLCDAEVALIIFSTKGKLYEYSTDSWYAHTPLASVCLRFDAVRCVLHHFQAVSETMNYVRCVFRNYLFEFVENFLALDYGIHRRTARVIYNI